MMRYVELLAAGRALRAGAPTRMLTREGRMDALAVAELEAARDALLAEQQTALALLERRDGEGLVEAAKALRDRVVALVQETGRLEARLRERERGVTGGRLRSENVGGNVHDAVAYLNREAPGCAVEAIVPVGRATVVVWREPEEA